MLSFFSQPHSNKGNLYTKVLKLIRTLNTVLISEITSNDTFVLEDKEYFTNKTDMIVDYCENKIPLILTGLD